MSLLLLAIAGVYAGSLDAPFLFDDQSSLLENPSLRRLSSPGSVMFPPPEAGVRGRPLANLTYALNFNIHGLDPRGFRAVNIALLAASALTLAGLVRRTLQLDSIAPALRSRAEEISLSSAALWSLHPLHTNVVTYLSQRVEGMMALFYLLTLYCFVRYIHSSHRAWAVCCALACALGMASKEVMISAPVAVLLYDRAFVAGSFMGALRSRAGLYLGLAGTWMGLAALMMSAQLAERGIGYSLGVTPIDYALTGCKAMWTYLRLSIWPSPLVFDYGWAFLASRTAALPFVFVIGILVAAVLLALWRSPRIGTLGAFFFLVLAPTSTIAPIVQQPIAENRAHLPLVVVAIGAALIVTLLPRKAYWPAVLTLTVMLSALTVRRNTDFRSAVALWEDTVRKRPENARAQNNLGAALLAEHRANEAIPRLLQAARLQPAYAEPRHNLGLAYLQLGRPDLAQPWLSDAVKIRPEAAEMHRSLGTLYHATQRFSEAEASLMRALELRPADANTHNDLSVVLFEQGRFDEAAVAAERARQLAPNNPTAEFNLANSLLRLGQIEPAISHYQAALKHEPEFVKARNNLGVALLLAGRNQEAATALEAVLKLQPDHPDARRYLEMARQQKP